MWFMISAVSVPCFIFLSLFQVSVAFAQNGTPVTPPHLAKTTQKSPAKNATPKAKLLHFDQFEYRVSRNKDPNGAKAFKKHGGWSGAKAINITGSHAGYLYTVDRIPGYKGRFPGKDSKSVLAIEARPATFETQTDFYLQYGSGYGSTETVPGNVWFQFWIYPNHYDDPDDDEQDQLSAFTNRFKFIYPCNSNYPCRQGQLKWLNMLGFTTSEPYWADEGNTELFMTTVEPFNISINYELAKEYNKFKIGQTDISENIAPNRWTLVKIHYDTSTSSGKYEAWMRPLGGSWVKVAEWIDGKTPDFSWKIPDDMIGGHRVFRMPTTVDDFDSWIYLDDFAMATAEEALPRY